MAYRPLFFAVSLKGITQGNISAYEGTDVGGVGDGMVVETTRMDAARTDPLRLRLGLGSVEARQHGEGHEGVAVAMNEEHWLVAAGHLAQRRSLVEAPAVAEATEGAAGVEQGEGGEAEAVVELALKLVPGAGVATVFDKALHIGGEPFARDAHHGGSSHRHAVEHHLRVATMTETTVGHLHPAHHVKAVEPTHLHGLTLAAAVCVEVGEEKIEPHVVVDGGNVHHPHTVVLIAVDKEGHTVGGAGSEDVGGVVALARGHGDKSVAQGLVALQTVGPGAQLRVFVDDVVEAPREVVAMLHRRTEGIAQHILTAQTKGGEEQHTDDGEGHKSPLAGGEGTLFISLFIMSIHL